MPWTYKQSTGELSHDGVLVGRGYSGAYGSTENNPADQQEKGLGPLPQGFYTIQAPDNNPKTGPYSLPLTPDPGNEMFGRSGFLIHGDSINNPGHASEGCIILAIALRHVIWSSGDRRLAVVE